MKALLTWLLNSKAAKVGGASAGAGTIIAAVIGANAAIDNKIEKVDTNTKIYVDLKHDQVMTEVKNLNDGQTDIKDLLKVIDKRLYNLKQGEK